MGLLNLIKNRDDNIEAKMDQAVIDLKAALQKMSVNLDVFITKDGKMSKNIENQIEGMSDKVLELETTRSEAPSKRSRTRCRVKLTVTPSIWMTKRTNYRVTQKNVP